MRPPKLKKPDVSVIYINNIPADLKADFKAYCAKRRTTMRKVIIRMMQEKRKKLKAQQ